MERLVIPGDAFHGSPRPNLANMNQSGLQPLPIFLGVLARMMSTKGVEYLQRAQECRDKALIVQSEVEKERWLRMAREWDELAEQYHPTASTDWIRNRASQMSDNPGHEDETGDEREENE